MKMSSSEMGPAVMPSGGLVSRCLYSWKRRREETVVAMVAGGGVPGGKGGGVGWGGVVVDEGVDG